MLDCYPEGIALLGADGQIVFWNRAAESVSGFTGIEVVARDLPDALEPLRSSPRTPANSAPKPPICLLTA
ncbi:MAG TPA: PAS domain-containing protein [Terracidiphilus sp.]|nr:PAS domain-containing protein [Terracidiphilus sp.]